MSRIQFIDNNGTFKLKNPQHTSGLYLPLAGTKGLKSAVTPDFGGDAKVDQNHFLIAPKSIMNLSADRDTRNFFLIYPDGLWSATGTSAAQEADRFTVSTTMLGETELIYQFKEKKDYIPGDYKVTGITVEFFDGTMVNSEADELIGEDAKRIRNRQAKAVTVTIE